MKPVRISYFDELVALDLPAGLHKDVIGFFGLALSGAGKPTRHGTVTEETNGRYVIDLAGDQSPAVNRGEALHRLAVFIGQTLAIQAPGVALRAAGPPLVVAGECRSRIHDVPARTDAGPRQRVSLTDPAFAWTCTAKNASGATYTAIGLLKLSTEARALVRCQIMSAGASPGSCVVVDCDP